MGAQRIKSVEVCNLGNSVVAGLVPATTLSPVTYITTDFIGCA